MTQKLAFRSDLDYGNREQRAQYTWLKYQSILRGRSILDVGADRCFLKQWLDPDARYWGIGVGGEPDQQFDLESGPLPFADGAYDVVLCLDVLEHLEGIHRVFDELCRVSRQHVIVSLPNCLGFLWQVLTRFGMETDDRLMKYYGLPDEPPADRHRWFFDAVEAEQFVRRRALRNRMEVAHLDFVSPTRKPTRKKRLLWACARRVLLRRDIDRQRLFRGAMWAVLEHRQA